MDFTTLWTQTSSTIENVVLAIALGAIIGSFIMLFQKKHMGKLVRKLIAKEASNADSACTLADLELTKSPFIKKALCDPTSALSRIVCHEGDEPITKHNLLETKFWLDPNKKDDAEKRYSTKNSNIFLVLLTAVILLVLAYLLIKYIPILLQFNPFGE